VNESLSIILPTHRRSAGFQWFADSLAGQLGDEDIEVIVVDSRFSEERTAAFAAAVADRFPLRHVAAKPSPYNGPHRVTATSYFAASSARNTGLVYATKPYVVLVDDAAVLMPGWLDEAVEASRHEYLVAGAYQKHWDMRVENGVLLGSRSGGVDSRWEYGDDCRVVEVPGTMLYGCTFGAPRELLVEVGGYDELCDSVAGEDYQLGIRLEHAGHRLFYSRRMLIIESEELHRDGPTLQRMTNVLSEPAYLDRLAEFGVTRRTVTGRLDATHMVLDILYGRHQQRSLGNRFDLRRLRPADLPGLADRFPERHWFTGEPLAGMSDPDTPDEVGLPGLGEPSAETGSR